MKEKDYDLSTRCVHVAVLESPLWPQGDHDRLFVAGGHWGALVVVPRHMDDSEIDLRLDLPRAGSHTGTFREPALFQARGWGSLPTRGLFPFPRLSTTIDYCLGGG
jgi:hypothetical protein